MINTAFFLGQPVQFKDICEIYPPTINDTYKNKHFSQIQQAFTLSQEEIEDELLGINRDTQIDRVPTPFEFLLNNCYHNQEFNSIIYEAFEFFTHETVIILPEQGLIIFGESDNVLKNVKSFDELRTINENNYFDFQNLIRQALGQKEIEPPKPNEDIRVTRIKAKARYRDKIKAKNTGKNQFSDILVAICCMGIGISPLNLGELSYVAVNALVEKYQTKEKYDIDIRSLLAGADSKKVKPKYWIGNN